MKSFYLVVGILVLLWGGSANAAISYGFCSGSGKTCWSAADCLPDEYCLGIGGGGGGCSTCSDCTTIDWGAYSTGYEKRTVATCNTSTCVCTKTAEYRCAVGYYGTSTNGTSGCTRCPESGQSVAGSTDITSCYLPAGTAFSDSTGSGTYTSDCYYTE